MKNTFVLALIQIVFLLLNALNQGQVTYHPLNEFISDYEPLYYNRKYIQDQVEKGNDTLKLRFSACFRIFSINLTPNKEIFEQGAKFRVVSGNHVENIEFDSSQFYTGIVEGESWSRVSGRIENGSFNGMIDTSDETYHVEPSWQYFSTPQVFHSVIFKSSSIHFNTHSIKRITVSVDESMSVHHHKLPFNITSQEMSRRQKRSSNDFRKTLNTCPVLLACDASFYSEIAMNSEASAMSEMTYHLTEADNIFRSTDFDGDVMGDNIGFTVAAITVFKDASAEGILNSPSDIEVSKYLNKWSEFNHNPYCTALLFTNRDFDGGVLGLAWVGKEEEGTPGGICQERLSLSLDGNKVEMNFNSALVTFKNFGNKVPRRVSILTVAHEFGHNFGSDHDPDTDICSPGGKQGNFVMYAKATDGTNSNNKIFSPCSRMQMNNVINKKGVKCFRAHNNGTFCGNSIVEGDENCDCGLEASCDYIDSCCSTNCTIRQGKQCSPKAGPCCTEFCQFTPLSNNKVCRRETECAYASICSGANGKCPDFVSKPNNKTCNNGANTCVNGACVGSVCALYGFTECECTSVKKEFCHVCCRTNQGACVSTESFLPQVVIHPAGKACDSYAGYCDGEGVCIMVDPDEQLNKLKEVIENLFSQRTLDLILQWIRNKWYYVVAMICGVLLIIYLLKITYQQRVPIAALAERVILPHMLQEQEENELNQVQQQQQQQQEEQTDNSDEPEVFDARQVLYRLAYFFPNVELEALLYTLKHSPNEEAATCRLLAMGYGFNPVMPPAIPRADEIEAPT